MSLDINKEKLIKTPYNLNIINLENSGQEEYNFKPTSSVPILGDQSPFGSIVSSLGKDGFSTVACVTPQPIEYLQKFFNSTLNQIQVNNFFFLFNFILILFFIFYFNFILILFFIFFIFVLENV